ncbi:MAG: hypothetical protein KBA32_15500 [Propionivibrio sp.]|jgi:hypothetical protein|uniref:hypothetical protein n=1 Tax=Propionivibrio sp. TaxID=2212460 RepID=UPI001B656C0E|nr:hypothetical protein [Propionivibrio sp.]MBP7204592.1 hypothetical protein [Propionivibrio sp.]
MFFKVSVVGMAISFQNDTILVPFRHQGQVGKTVGKQRGRVRKSHLRTEGSRNGAQRLALHTLRLLNAQVHRRQVSRCSFRKISIPDFLDSSNTGRTHFFPGF